MEGSYVWGALCAAGSELFFLQSIAHRQISASKKSIRVLAVLTLGFFFIFTVSKLEPPSAFSDFEFWLGVISIPTNLGFYLWQERKYRLLPKPEQADLTRNAITNSKWKSEQLRKLTELSWMASIMKLSSTKSNDYEEAVVFENSIKRVIYYAIRRTGIFALSILISSFAQETYYAVTQNSTFTISPLDFEVFTLELKVLPMLFFFSVAVFLVVDLATLQSLPSLGPYSKTRLIFLLIIVMFGLNFILLITRPYPTTFWLDESAILLSLWSNSVVVLSALLLRRTNKLMLDSFSS
jgi:hypothetical protein